MPSINIDSIVNKVLKMDDDDSKNQINIAVFVDETVGVELRAVARRLLVPATEDVRMHIESYYDDPAVVDSRADLTVIIANASPWTGATYGISRSKGIDTVVLAENLGMVIRLSEETQFDIDHDDILSTEIISTRLVPVRDAVVGAANLGIDALEVVVNAAAHDLPKAFIGRPLLQERVDFNRPAEQPEPDFEQLFEALGDWVVRHCSKLRETFVAAYPFALKGMSGHYVRKTAFQNAVTAGIFFTPGADLPVMTLNEIKMLVQVERAHGYGIGKELIPEAAGIVVFAFVSRAVARALVHRIPVFGWIVKTAYGYVVTLLLGKAIERYCEAGRKLPEPLQQIVEKAFGVAVDVLPLPDKVKAFLPGTSAEVAGVEA